MIRRSNRGIRRATMRVRLAVAAAVVVGAGAAGLVAVAATHNSTATTQAAAYTSGGRTLSYTSAMSAAMNGWNRSPNQSIVTISHMKPMTSWYMAPWHNHTIALQRGTVIATAKNQIVVRSASRALELWYLNRGTHVLNVADNPTARSAMNGGTMKMPAQMNTKTKTLAKGDLVFVFGERLKGKFVAQLVLFVAPANPAPKATPTPATTAPVAPVPASTTPPAFSGNNS